MNGERAPSVRAGLWLGARFNPKHAVIAITPEDAKRLNAYFSHGNKH
ncbi:hypothetical protein [Asticcacaulis tiandongensis]|nr:hypothetical protein [Asticcacaulis tiandongensis]